MIPIKTVLWRKTSLFLTCILIYAFMCDFFINSNPVDTALTNDFHCKKIIVRGRYYEYFETHHLGEINHVGPIWFSTPSSVITIRFKEEIELIVDGEIQRVEPPVSIFIFRFSGFSPPPRPLLQPMGKIFLYGSCEEYLIHRDVEMDNLSQVSRLFNVSVFTEFGQTAYGLASADFNNDGLIDFAVSWATCPWNKSAISIFYNNGNHVFTRGDIYVYENNTEKCCPRYIDDLDAADYDNDGDIDLMFTYSESVYRHGLCPATNGTINILYNNGVGVFGNETLVDRHCSDIDDLYGRFNPHTTSADFDNDGDIDFIVGDNSGVIELYINDSSGGFKSNGILYDYGVFSWGLTSGDFDNDGDIDLLIAARQENQDGLGFIYLKKNLLVETNGSTYFANNSPGIEICALENAIGTCSLQTMDYNGDHLLDFIAGTEGITLYINKGNDTFDDFYLGNLPGIYNGYWPGHVDHLYYGGMTTFDINQDDREDLIIGGVGGVVRFCFNNYSQLPPLKPFISGDTLCKYGIKEEYIIYTKDINGDDIYYYINWGDNTTTGWIGPYSSGEEVIVNHTWYDYGGHRIIVVAKDINGHESPIREYQTLILRETLD